MSEIGQRPTPVLPSCSWTEYHPSPKLPNPHEATQPTQSQADLSVHCDRVRDGGWPCLLSLWPHFSSSTFRCQIGQQHSLATQGSAPPPSVSGSPNQTEISWSCRGSLAAQMILQYAQNRGKWEPFSAGSPPGFRTACSCIQNVWIPLVWLQLANYKKLCAKLFSQWPSHS